MSLLKRVRLDVDTEIASLRKDIEEIEVTIRWLESKRDERRQAHDGAAGSLLTQEVYAAFDTHISGKDAAIRFLRDAGESKHVSEIHIGAIGFGAQITLPGLQSMMTKYAKREVDFVKAQRPGFFGLIEFQNQEQEAEKPE